MKKLLQYPQAAYVLIGLITFGVYANSLHNPFHYDDLHSIVDNPHVRDIGRIPSFFVDPTAFSAEADNAMYRPLLLATFAINYAISGYEVYSYHLVALGLHLGCVLLLGAVARQLLADQYAAYFAAALFALHPINTEPINYISSRSEILASFFFLLGLYAYLRPGHRRYLWVGLAFAGGLLSKSTTVVFPLVLVAYELICYRRLQRADKGLYALLAGVASLYLMMVWTFLKKAAITAPVRPYDQQLWTQVKAMVFYLQMLVWPARQNVDHQFLLSDSLFEPIAASASFFLLSLVFLAIYHARQHPIPLWTLAWFLIALMPASLVPLNVLVNEHRLYLPCAAFALVSGYAGLALGKRVGRQWVLALGFAVLLAASWKTIERNGVWQNEYTLWRDAAAKAPLMARPSIFLGNAYMRDNRVVEAVAAFKHVLRRDPGFYPAHMHLATLYRRLGRDQQAVDILKKGLHLDPTNPAMWSALAESYRSQSGWHQSLSAYEKAVELAPEDAALRNNLGNIYQVLGRAPDALVHHQRALAIAPGDAETLLNLGNAHLMLQQLQEALAHYQQAASARDDFAGAWFNMGYVLEKMALIERALSAYDRAVAIDPAYTSQVAARRRGIVAK